jgi:thioredoxin reductase (NADPH)
MDAVAQAAPIETDALVIGAGPVGLFQVFQLGLQEIRAQVVDSLPYAGGQCVELYADKPIYDIPSVQVCTGRQLTDNLLRQIEPFGAGFHFGQVVTTLERQADGRLLAGTSLGTRFLAKTLFIAAGVGAFQPRRLKVEGLERFEGSQVFHTAWNPAACAGKHVVVVGGDDAALAAAVDLAQDGPQRAAGVTLLHRRDAFQADASRVALMRELCAAGRMRLAIGQVTGCEAGADRLAALRVTGVEGDTQPMPLDTLLVFLGLSPKLGPVAGWGLALERKQLVVDTETFATSEPGIFAVGDINTYPGKRKLIVSGFHEATLAAFGAAAHIFPGQKIPLQYTTTSPRLHQLLGVESSLPD